MACRGGRAHVCGAGWAFRVLSPALGVCCPSIGLGPCPGTRDMGFGPHHTCLFCLQITGPWRSLWIRFGYDPRKHPEAKIYQVLDFRIRCGMKYGKREGFCPPPLWLPVLSLLFWCGEERPPQ